MLYFPPSLHKKGVQINIRPSVPDAEATVVGSCLLLFHLILSCSQVVDFGICRFLPVPPGMLFNQIKHSVYSMEYSMTRHINNLYPIRKRAKCSASIIKAVDKQQYTTSPNCNREALGPDIN